MEPCELCHKPTCYLLTTRCRRCKRIVCNADCVEGPDLCVDCAKAEAEELAITATGGDWKDLQSPEEVVIAEHAIEERNKKQ